MPKVDWDFQVMEERLRRCGIEINKIENTEECRKAIDFFFRNYYGGRDFGIHEDMRLVHWQDGDADGPSYVLTKEDGKDKIIYYNDGATPEVKAFYEKRKREYLERAQKKEEV